MKHPELFDWSDKNLKKGTQQQRILSELVRNGFVEVWRLITPRPSGGLGCAQYNARIKELREMLSTLGYEIRNEAGRKFELCRKVEQWRLI